MASQTASVTPVADPINATPKSLQPAVTDEDSPVPVVMPASPKDVIKPKAIKLQTPMNGPSIAPPIDLEIYLHQTLNLCNELAKTNLNDHTLNNPTPQSSVMGLSTEVAAAKMLNYCIRMLHADGWHPPTVIRAMVLREYGLETGMKNTLYKALRERREEMKSIEAKKAGVGNDSVEGVTEMGMKKSGAKNAGRRGTMPSRSRKGRAATVSGTDKAKGVEAKEMTTSDTLVEQVVGGSEQGRGGPFMSLI